MGKVADMITAGTGVSRKRAEKLEWRLKEAGLLTDQEAAEAEEVGEVGEVIVKEKQEVIKESEKKSKKEVMVNDIPKQRR